MHWGGFGARNDGQFCPFTGFFQWWLLVDSSLLFTSPNSYHQAGQMSRSSCVRRWENDPLEGNLTESALSRVSSWGERFRWQVFDGWSASVRLLFFALQSPFFGLWISFAGMLMIGTTSGENGNVFKRPHSCRMKSKALFSDVKRKRDGVGHY